jgi:hypothetical protein
VRKSKKIILSAISAVGLSILWACGGGGSSATTAATQTGYFIDSAVGGLQYTSGSLSGVTGSDGSFQYQAGQPVTFKIGNLTLGSVTPSGSNVYPVDLVSGATDQTNANVTLISQVLQTLDDDGNTANGITISPSTQTALSSSAFAPIALNTATASTATTQLAAALQNNPITLTSGAVSALISQATAQAHLQSSLLSQYIGTWKGTYSGTDSGTCQLTILAGGASTMPAGTFATTGTCTSVNTAYPTFTLTGYVTSSGAWTTGTVTSGATYSGNLSKNGTASGTWQNNGYSGSWTMTKQ